MQLWWILTQGVSLRKPLKEITYVASICRSMNEGVTVHRYQIEMKPHHVKLFTLAYRALSTQQPSYLASLLHLSNIPRQLRSSISQLIVPKTKLNLGKYAFSVAAPRVWNELPITLKTSETIAIFRKKLKTYLFQLAFPP